MINRRQVADKIASYLHHELTLNQLVDWAEWALMEGDTADAETPMLAKVLARIGLADVRAFGLTWDDCDDILHQLGFAAHVDVVAA